MMSFFSYLKNVLVANRGLANLSLTEHKEIYKEWSGQVRSKKFPLDLELPWITIIAKNYIERFLHLRSKQQTRIFEYGSGGSTLFFLHYATEVVSVEHDKEWFGLVQKRINDKKLAGWKGYFIEPEFIGSKAKLELDISDPRHYCTDDLKYSEYTFRNYATCISKFPDDYFDLVLVDGRSRPSCLFHSLNKIKSGGLLVLDNAERKYYLSQNIIQEKNFTLASSLWGALICYNQFTRTNIYIKK